MGVSRLRRRRMDAPGSRGIPAQSDALLAHFGREAGDRSGSLAGQNGRAIGQACGAAISIFQLDKVGEGTRSAGGKRSRQGLGECGRGGGCDLQLAGGRTRLHIAGLPFATADMHIDVALQRQLIGIAAGHGPGERNLVADARSGKVLYTIGQVERRRQGRAGGSASGKKCRQADGKNQSQAELCFTMCGRHCKDRIKQQSACDIFPDRRGEMWGLQIRRSHG